VARHSGFDQSNALLHLSQHLFNNKLQLQLNSGITHRNITKIDSDVFYQAAIYNPTAPIRTDTSRFGGFYQRDIFDYYNPVALLEQISNTGDQTIYTNNLNARWNLFKNVTAKVQYGWQQEAQTQQYRLDTDRFQPRYLENYDTKYNSQNQLFTTSLRYYFYKNDHDFDLTGGYQYQTWTNDFRQQTLADSTLADSKTKTELAAFFGNLQYNFRNWLFASAHWRHEGSTRFGDNRKWGNFYGFGTGVNVTELVNLSFSQYLKLRISYGVSGNLPPDGVYADKILRPSAWYLNNGVFKPTVDYFINENQSLQWEARREWNWGFDFEFFNGLLRGSVDWYQQQNQGLVWQYFVPSPPNLANIHYENSVDLSNRGAEFTLNATLLRQSDFSWESGLNYAKNHLRLDAISPSLREDVDGFAPSVYLGTPGGGGFAPYQAQEGAPLGQLYGFIFERSENGEAIYKDVNSDGRFCGCPDDQADLGNAYPRFTLGWSHQLRWKALELNVFLRGVFGHKIVNAHKRLYTLWQGGDRNVHRSALENNFNNILGKGQLADVQVENGSFATLENLVLSYAVPSKKFSRLKVYAAAQNLFTLSNYSGVDPEVRLSNRVGEFRNVLAPGFDARMAYLPARTFTLGVQAEW
jgi:iron complex outermembrane receptor protein